MKRTLYAALTAAPVVKRVLFFASLTIGASALAGLPPVCEGNELGICVMPDPMEEESSVSVDFWSAVEEAQQDDPGEFKDPPDIPTEARRRKGERSIAPDSERYQKQDFRPLIPEPPRPPVRLANMVRDPWEAPYCWEGTSEPWPGRCEPWMPCEPCPPDTWGPDPWLDRWPNDPIGPYRCYPVNGIWEFRVDAQRHDPDWFGPDEPTWPDHYDNDPDELIIHHWPRHHATT